MNTFVLSCFLLVTAAACITLPALPPQYEVTRLYRKNLRSQPCIVGRIDQPFARDGRVQYIAIFTDGIISYPDTAGNYCLVFHSGVHTVRFGTVGLKLVSVKNLRLRTGDSIRLNVHMRQDSVSLR